MITQPLLNHLDYLIIIGRCEEEKYLLTVENQRLQKEVEELRGKLESSNSNEQLPVSPFRT